MPALNNGHRPKLVFVIGKRHPDCFQTNKFREGPASIDLAIKFKIVLRKAAAQLAE